MPSSSSGETSNAYSASSDECGYWSTRENKVFENALATYGEELPDQWERIFEQLLGKTPEQIKKHYESLVEDLNFIDAGRIPIPQYANEEEDSDEEYFGLRRLKKSKHVVREQQRRKGIPWTEDEHRLFLMGLNTYGKGDWRSISRNFVISRTPTQVASHAQKYFNRLNSARTKERRRPSIHDIRSSDVVTSMNPLPHSSPCTNFTSYIAPSLHSFSLSPITGSRDEGMSTYSINDLMGARGSYPPPAMTFSGGFEAFPSSTEMFVGSWVHCEELDKGDAMYNVGGSCTF
ncbi:transcription factor DIVARICATA-like [Aristolochia californica]|uniref:transcription factor DIVARICATA-like n=1 Tax=Aristolochia californica TaxID=171875 RepID=UPI0035DD1CB3